MYRLLTLTLGPALLVGLSYLVAQPSFERPAPIADPQHEAETIVRPSESSSVLTHVAEAPLLAACQRKRESLVKRLGRDFHSVVHTPFVLVGDFPPAALERHYRQTIAPTAKALSVAYFDKTPDKPIAVILLSGDAAYRECANRLDGQERAEFAGYYERGDYRIVLNTATGDGTIAHELTHALAQFDFPDMPEWFDEGLASLHEEARFSEDGLRIYGSTNWRGRHLIPTIEHSQLRPLEALIGDLHLRSERQADDYAHARYFCLFLQQRRLLEPFYRKLRLAVRDDPTGLATLRRLFGVADLSSVDLEFRRWAMALEGSHPAGRNTRRNAASSPAAGIKTPVDSDADEL
jgi:hypothetical protein